MHFVSTVLLSSIGLTIHSWAIAESSAALQMVRGVHPVLTVILDGHTQARMLIDTGAARTLLAPGLAPRGSIVDICLTESVCVKDLPVDSYSSTYSNPKPGFYNGLIGWDILSKLVTVLGYKAATVHFGISGGGPALAYSLDQWGRPHAPVAIAGKVLQDMLLDTGSSYVRVTEAQADELGDSFHANGLEVSLTVGVPETTTLSAPVSVCVGDICAQKTVLQKARWPAVGGTFFRNFKVTIDGPAGVLRLAPDDAGPMVSSLQRYGIQLSPDNASDILLVSKDSPAALAAITTSDRLLSISGKSVESVGYFGAMALLEDTNIASIQLTLQGSSTQRTVSLTAAPQSSSPGHRPHQQQPAQSPGQRSQPAVR
jgi:hypothetical protein